MENKKQEIINAAYNVLIDKGIEGLSISKVGEYACVPKSLIFHYFINKDALISAVVEYVLKELDFDIQNRLYLSGELNEQDFEEYLDLLYSIDFEDKRLIEAYYACHYLGMRNDVLNNKLRDSLGYERKNYHLSFSTFAEAGVISKRNISLAIEYVITTASGIAKIADIENGQDSIRSEVIELHKDCIRALLKLEG